MFHIVRAKEGLSEDLSEREDGKYLEELEVFFKMSPSRPLFRLFSVFSNKQYNVYNKSM